MQDRPVARTRVESVLIGACLVTTLGFILACASAPPPVPLPVSRWANGYAWRYEPPTKAGAASTKINVIVVNPFYREPDSVLNEQFYSRVGRGFSRSMGVDLDKVIIAKGMTAVGPYQTLDDVTYPDKKGADLTLAPRVFLTTQTKFGQMYHRNYNNVGHMEKPFTMRISGWVSYEMREPLSGQKMWVKRVDLDDREVRGVQIHEAVAVRRDQYGHVVQWGEGEIKFSGREDALADALAAWYPEIMRRAWTFLSTEEMLDLKEKTKEIRDRKVY